MISKCTRRGSENKAPNDDVLEGSKEEVQRTKLQILQIFEAQFST